MTEAKSRGRRALEWVLLTAVLFLLVKDSVHGFGATDTVNDTAAETSEGFNLHDDYANPMDVCGTYDFRPVLVSEPWNHTTIVMCARWARGEMVIVTQAGNSPAEVDFEGSFMWPSYWSAPGEVPPFGAAGICGGDELVGIMDSTGDVIKRTGAYGSQPVRGVWPMCFNAETRRVRFVVASSRNKGPLTNVTLASQLRY
ncbi:hypothetical protein HOI83_02675 [Candidatus Uhrbacteria bacterium]|jgi:hypothetical protein|nr:hypothetical protein [Candidatus Uhrbacteria bacterium]